MHLSKIEQKRKKLSVSFFFFEDIHSFHFEQREDKLFKPKFHLLISLFPERNKTIYMFRK